MNELKHFRKIFLNKKQNALNKLKFYRKKYKNTINEMTLNINKTRLNFKEFYDKLEKINERKGVKDYD